MAEDARPEVLLFVAGVGDYTEPSLNKLQYTAQDAADIYAQFERVAKLAKGSRLVRGLAGKPLTRDLLEDELIDFSNYIGHNQRVVVYFGGHGKVIETTGRKRLQLLPSDYRPPDDGSNRPGRNYLYWDDLKEILSNQIEFGAGLTGVKLVFLVNACGSGLAAGAMAAETDQRLVDQVSDLAKELRLGQADMAVIPAASGDRSTFERTELGRSEMAYWLMAALRGEADTSRDSAITTGELYDFLKTPLKLRPRPDGFADSIPVAGTSELHARAQLEMGTALDFLARGAGGAIPHEIATLLGRQATAHLRFARGRDPAIDDRAALRLAARLDQAERRHILDDLAVREQGGTLHLSDRERDVFRLAEAEPGMMSLDERLSIVRTASAYFIYQAQPWPTSLSYRFSAERVRAGFMHRVSPLTQPVHVLAQSSLGGNRPDLSSWEPAITELAPEQHAVISIFNSSRCDETCPFSDALAKDLVKLRARTAGKIFIILNSQNVGGDAAPLLAADIPVMVVSAETWHQSTGKNLAYVDANEILAKAITAPTAEDFERELRSASKALWEVTQLRRNTPSGPHTPWPGLRVQLLAERSALDDLGSSPDKSLLRAVSDNCLVGDVINCRSTPALQTLAMGVESDEALNVLDAQRQYRHAIDELRGVASVRSASLDQALGDIRDRLIRTVERRLDDLPTKIAGRQIVVQPFYAEEYRSPYLPDLVKTAADAALIGPAVKDLVDRLHQITGGGAPLDLSATAKAPVEMIDALQLEAELKQLAEAHRNSEDVAVVYITGRGVERDGRRYIATASYDPDVDDSDADDSDVDDSHDPRDEGLVDVEDILTLLIRVHALVILDVQFTVPTDPERREALLDKHIDAGRGIAVEVPPATGGIEFLGDLSGDALQVVLWADGDVAQSPHPACAAHDQDTPSSPMAADLLHALNETKGETYRAFLQRVVAAGCAVRTASYRAQGALDVPLFSSGRNAREIARLGRPDLTTEIGLHVAHALAQDLNAIFPSDAGLMTEAALVLAIDTGFGDDSVLAARLPDGALAKAEQRLDSMDVAKLEPADLAAYWELRARLAIADGRLSDARRLIQLLPPEILRTRNLSDLLVEVVLTSIRADTESVLLEAVEALSAAEGGADPRLDSLKILLADERAKRGEFFRLGQK
ncbi:hypothetical protein [Paracoccus ravus]|uniref:hypothetical protein n=1 Tax=Paracoccus ravus TaxID=2447760 RepID=UPI00106EAFF0|nr:hypothetical protein [Paracoccus ravus]